MPKADCVDCLINNMVGGEPVKPNACGHCVRLIGTKGIGKQ